MLSKVQNISLSLTQGFFSLFLFSIPFQVGIKIYDTIAYQNGVFLEYLAGSIFLADIFFLMAAFFFGIYLLTTHQFHSISFGDKRIWLILGLLVLAVLVPIFWSEYPGLIIKDAIRILEYAGIYLLIINIPAKITAWLKILLASILLQSLIGIFQFFFQQAIGLSILGEPLIHRLQAGVAHFNWQGGEILRAFGTLSHPNTLAILITIGIFLGILLVYENKKHASEEATFPWAKYMFFILFFGLLVTFSRSVWIAAIVGIFVLMRYCKDQWFKKIMGFAGIIFLTIGIVFFTSFLSDTWAFRGRMELMDYGTKVLMQNPLGIGSSHFSLHIQDAADRILNPWEIRPVHNIFTLQAIENGFLGLVFCIAFWFVIVRILKEHKKEEEAGIFIGLFSAIFILWLIDHSFHDVYAGQMYLWLIVSIATAALDRHKKLKTAEE